MNPGLSALIEQFRGNEKLASRADRTAGLSEEQPTSGVSPIQKQHKDKSSRHHRQCTAAERFPGLAHQLESNKYKPSAVIPTTG